MIKRLNKIISVHILIFNLNKSHPDSNVKLEDKKCIPKYSIAFEKSNSRMHGISFDLFKYIWCNNITCKSAYNVCANDTLCMRLLCT